jgi:hypothetical protein
VTHHDSVGVLHPSQRLASRHRLYSAADLLTPQPNLDLPSESAKAHELAARWDRIHELARPLFQSNEKLWHSVGRAHLDGWYDHIADAGHAEDYAFIQRVKEATAQ